MKDVSINKCDGIHQIQGNIWEIIGPVAIIIGRLVLMIGERVGVGWILFFSHQLRQVS